MDRDSYEKLQEERKAELRTAAADRPAHAKYLTALLGGTADGVDDVPLPAGVGKAAAEALRMDAEWCLRPPLLDEDGQVSHRDSGNHFPYAYRALRLDQLRRARARRLAKGQSGPDIVRSLIQL